MSDRPPEGEDGEPVFISDDDMKGLAERAKREGKTTQELINELKQKGELRASGTDPVTAKEVEAVVDRAAATGEIKLRRNDNPHEFFGLLRKFLKEAGHAFEDEEGDGKSEKDGD